MVWKALGEIINGFSVLLVVTRLSKIWQYDNIVTMTVLSLYCQDNIVTIYDNKTIGLWYRLEFFNLRKKYFSKQKIDTFILAT